MSGPGAGAYWTRAACIAIALGVLLAGCATQLAPTAIVVVWEDVGGSEAGFASDCKRCRAHVGFESLAQDFESPVSRTTGAERYARAMAWGRSTLRECLEESGYVVRIAPAAQAASPARMCGIQNVIYSL